MSRLSKVLFVSLSAALALLAPLGYATAAGEDATEPMALLIGVLPHAAATAAVEASPPPSAEAPADAADAADAPDAAVEAAIEPPLTPEPEPEPEPIVLRAPGVAPWATGDAAPVVDEPGLKGLSYHFSGEVYSRPNEQFDIVGMLRRGNLLPLTERVDGAGCDGGWYRTAHVGYVCTTRGFVVSGSPDDGGLWRATADVSSSLPYRYAKVVRDGAPRYYRLPSAQERLLAEQAIRGEAPMPDVVESAMRGVYLVAVAEEAEHDGARFVRTVRDRWIQVEDVEDKLPVVMRGEQLGGALHLPMAFVYGEDRELSRFDGGTMGLVGVAEKHSRFVVEAEREQGGQMWLEGAEGLAVARQDARVAQRIARPEEIPPGRKWIHVNLSEQTLVAYEGDEPVFATLVSSGKEGYDTPSGTFRIREKYVSITMNGDDPLDGFYEVEEVPWTLYYWNSFALHGAYWHEGFGEVRSHGCTNVPPADARWLYHWSDPKVPAGWHGLRRHIGTWVHITS